ncbi:accessory gland protein Acp62F-like [Dendropsophus ebraccatus]|uniref:accessory gland protein Acp62F-like n=1 Tax=Dendropsophus ebraccatus TaxID=150705 RepID=UPI00383156E7
MSLPHKLLGLLVVVCFVSLIENSRVAAAPPCPAYMTFNECTRTPKETCDTLGIHYQPSEKCTSRCVCIDGYVLSNEAEPRCVKKTKCPKLI